MSVPSPVKALIPKVLELRTNSNAAMKGVAEKLQAMLEDLK